MTNGYFILVKLAEIKEPISLIKRIKEIGLSVNTGHTVFNELTASGLSLLPVPEDFDMDSTLFDDLLTLNVKCDKTIYQATETRPDTIRDNIARAAKACLDQVRTVRWGNSVASYETKEDNETDPKRKIAVTIKVESVSR